MSLRWFYCLLRLEVANRKASVQLWICGIKLGQIPSGLGFRDPSSQGLGFRV